MPPGTTELAVGNPLQSGGFLHADHALDLAILDRREPGCVELAGGKLATRVFQCGRTQQAADVLGTERRPCAGVSTALGGHAAPFAQRAPSQTVGRNQYFAAHDQARGPQQSGLEHARLLECAAEPQA